MSHTSYYQALGVPTDANSKSIRLAYLKLATVWHPDKNDSPEAQDRFVEIGEAYQVLSDPEKRDIYDEFGREGLSGFSGPSMTKDQALQQFWSFFRPSSYERTDTASAKHGAYVASVGAFSAPLKGLAVTVTVTGAGLYYGADTARIGFTEGAKDIIAGSKRLRSTQSPTPENEQHESGVQTIAHGLSMPFVGIVKGACLVTGATLAGVSFGLAGGLGGAVLNLKEGSSEVFDAAINRSRTPRELSAEACNTDLAHFPLRLLEDKVV